MYKKFPILSIIFIFLITPLIASANPSNTSSNLIKTPTSSSIYYQKNGERYSIPNETTFFSWFTNFDNVQIIPEKDLNKIPLVGILTIRPASKLIKFKSSNKIYFAEENPQGLTKIQPSVLRWIVNEKTASQIAGADWNNQILELPDALYSSYEFADYINLNDIEEINYDSCKSDSGTAYSCLKNFHDLSINNTNNTLITNFNLNGYPINKIEYAYLEIFADLNYPSCHCPDPATTFKFKINLNNKILSEEVKTNQTRDGFYPYKGSLVLDEQILPLIKNLNKNLAYFKLNWQTESYGPKYNCCDNVNPAIWENFQKAELRTRFEF
jgi:hypothetical protein